MNKIEYYNQLSKNQSLTPEQRSLAEALKTKERINATITGFGVPSGAAAGWMAGHPIVGAGVGSGLSRVNNWLWDKGLADAISKNDFSQYLYQEAPKEKKQNNTTPVSRQPVSQGQPLQAQNIQALSQPTGYASDIPADLYDDRGNEQMTPENIQAINDYVSRLQQVNEPYAEALNKFVNNYDNLAKGNFNAQRYFTAMAGLSGNPGYAKLAEALNPITRESDKLSAMKLMKDAQAGDINSINEVMGNLAIAQELGLPPEAAFANKNLLTVMSSKDRDKTKLEIAIANNLVKKYGIDKNYARAIAQQQLRNQAAREVANIYMGGATGGQPMAPQSISAANRTIMD